MNVETLLWVKTIAVRRWHLIGLLGAAACIPLWGADGRCGEAAARVASAVPPQGATRPSTSTNGPAPQQPTKEGQEAYDRALKAALHVQRAGELMDAEKYKDAERELLAADGLIPDYCTVLIPLSTAQFRLGKPDTALATLERAIRRGQAFDDNAYLLAARIFSGRKEFVAGQKKLIEWGGSRPVTANFHAAIGILKMGAYELGPAEVQLREALKADPGNEAALTGMTELYGRLGQYSRLQKFLDAGVEADPQSVPLLLLAGNSLLRQEKFNEATARFERLLELDPGNAAAHVNLASAYHSLGKTDLAISHFRRGVELDGTSVEAAINLARALGRTGKISEAREVLLAARKRGIDELELLNELVVVHSMSGELDAAIVAARESIARKADQPVVRALLEDLLEEKRAATAAADPSAAHAPEAGSTPAPR